MIIFLIFAKQYFSMGAKDLQKAKSTKKPPTPAQAPEESSEESNQTMPIHALEHLVLNQRDISDPLSTFEPDQARRQYDFLKSKPIRRRGRKSEMESKDKLRLKMHALTKRVEELEEKLREARNQEESCPHCHFYLNQPKVMQCQDATPEPDLMIPDCFKRSPSKDSLQFEKMDFQAPMMYTPEMEEKSWIFLGTVLIAMGSKVMDTDGTVNVFKIVKESVDQIRRQVQKSQEKLSLTFFMSKQELQVDNGMEELDFDPFYHNEQHLGGLQLESVRVESVEQYDLYFDQKLTFNVNYDALITAMEYMKQKSSLTFS